MKIILMILMLTLTKQGFTQNSDSTDQAEAEKQEQAEQQETETIKNPFQVGPYKNSQYEYFSDQDREAAAEEREKTQQSQ